MDDDGMIVLVQGNDLCESVNRYFEDYYPHGTPTWEVIQFMLLRKEPWTPKPKGRPKKGSGG